MKKLFVIAALAVACAAHAADIGQQRKDCATQTDRLAESHQSQTNDYHYFQSYYSPTYNHCYAIEYSSREEWKHSAIKVARLWDVLKKQIMADTYSDGTGEVCGIAPEMALAMRSN